MKLENSKDIIKTLRKIYAWKQEGCIFEKQIMKTQKNIVFSVYFNQFAVSIGITIAIGKGMQIHQVLFAHAA